jgi:acetyltransferase-like isoleucine patch superfamily enzyme
MAKRHANIKAKELKLGSDVLIHPTARVNCTRLELGDRSSVGAYALVEGRDVVIGKEAWIGDYAQIGGGSCFSPQSKLRVGDFFHLGRFAIVNTARPVQIGHEVGLGTHSCVFTHGAYTSEVDGFPVNFASVMIGDRVWIPCGIVNPGVTIGSDVVVATLSLVNKDLPSGCLAAGVPVRVLHENVYPKQMEANEAARFLQEIIDQVLSSEEFEKSKSTHNVAGYLCTVAGTTFDVRERTISGPSNELTEAFKNELRRHGVRFRYYARKGTYVPW